MVEAARPHVLAGLQFAEPALAQHLPESYRILIAASPAERWVEVICSCGESTSLDWPGSGISTYAQVLAQAWRSRACA